MDWLVKKGISLSTISGEERHGIVHRIDKETTGALVVAKNNEAHQKLSEQLQDKSMGRYYLMLLNEPLKEAKKVKLTFKSKGRGFQGVVKRYGFGGGPGSHGSRFHRAPGSIGNCEFPGRVMPGKKMPGHYGNKNVTVNAEVVEFDENLGVLVIKGSVPGANGSLGKVRIVK